MERNKETRTRDDWMIEGEMKDIRKGKERGKRKGKERKQIKGKCW